MGCGASAAAAHADANDFIQAPTSVDSASVAATTSKTSSSDNRTQEETKPKERSGVESDKAEGQGVSVAAKSPQVGTEDIFSSKVNKMEMDQPLSFVIFGATGDLARKKVAALTPTLSLTQTLTLALPGNGRLTTARAAAREVSGRGMRPSRPRDRCILREAGLALTLESEP